jgi:hypothetical protein
MPLTVQGSHVFVALQIGVAALHPESSLGSQATHVPSTHWSPLVLPSQSVSPRHSRHATEPAPAPSKS